MNLNPGNKCADLMNQFMALGTDGLKDYLLEKNIDVNIDANITTI